MSDLSDSDDDKQLLTDENGADWETAPEENDACSDDALSDRSRDNGHIEGSDGDFEDAWLDDYLPDAAVSTSFKQIGEFEDRNKSLQLLNGQDASNRVSFRRSSPEQELNTTPSLMLVDAFGQSVTNLSSPKLLGFKAFEGHDFGSERSKLPQSSEACSVAMIHPISSSISFDKSGKSDSFSRFPLTPLSPTTSPYKRANNLCFSPPSITTTKRLSPQPSNSSEDNCTELTRLQSYPHDLVLGENARKTSSRFLNESKRMAMWQDLKRAEEDIVTTSNISKSDEFAPSSLSKYKSTFPDARLDELLETLQAEVAAPSRREDSLVKQQNGAYQEVDFTSDDLLARESVCESGSLVSPRASKAFSISNTVTLSQSEHSAVPMAIPHSPAPSVAPTSLSQFELLQREYENLQQEKQNLHQEIQTLQHENDLLRVENKKTQDDFAIEHESVLHLSVKLQQLNEEAVQLREKQLHLDAMEHENRTFREMTQKLDMQAQSSNKLAKTLHDQVALTTKSEKQLKFEIKHLMEQNESLQADLLEKVASETTKFQNLANLSAENESLITELERRDIAQRERELDERQRMQGLVIHGLWRSKRRDVLRSALFQWSKSTQTVTSALTRALIMLFNAGHNQTLKLKAAAYSNIKLSASESKFTTTILKLQGNLHAAKRDTKAHCVLLGAMHLNRIIDNWTHWQIARMFSAWKTIQHEHVILSQSLELGLTKVKVLLAGQKKNVLRRAFSKWIFAAAHVKIRGDLERLHQLESSLFEAKECVFSLSRANAKLQEKHQSSSDDAQRLAGKMAKSYSELQLAKHAFVTTVLRDIERAWFRTVLSQWRMQTRVSVATKELQLQVEMAELKAAEREKYCKSVDDYSRVLRNDLERFQFFSLDKRITVDVLSKKLLREEERYRHMEERTVLLEEQAQALKTQLTSYVECDGLVLPFSVLTLCKDVAVSNLRELFQLHAAAESAVVVGASRESGGTEGKSPSPRLALSTLVRIIECSTLLEDKVVNRETLVERLAYHLPPYAVERGLLFTDFVTGLDQYLNETFANSTTKLEQLKRFWASLLSLIEELHGRKGGATGRVKPRYDPNVSGAGHNGTALLLCPSRPSWADRLSDDILKNQDKLLAVLEHETAVVERAVKEKASLKHTYQPSEHSSTGSINSSPFLEYQCDPLLPPVSPSHSTSTTVSGNLVNTALHDAGSNVVSTGATHGISMEVYTNWHLIPQVRDIFLALRNPLLKLVVQYSCGQRTSALGNQYCLPLTAIIRMLSDLKLHPNFLSRECVQSLFNRFREASDTKEGILTPQSLTLLLGSCAFELYAQSLATTPPLFLSAREILLSFFDDLGLLAESDIVLDARLCMVGMDVETILWSLFEYYANSSDTKPNTEGNNSRIGMTAAAFERFMTDIAGKLADDSRTLFRQVMQNSSKSGAKGDDKHWKMPFDEFYVAISYIQSERNPGITYATPGEAVRQWLQQSQ